MFHRFYGVHQLHQLQQAQLANFFSKPPHSTTYFFDGLLPQTCLEYQWMAWTWNYLALYLLEKGKICGNLGQKRFRSAVGVLLWSELLLQNWWNVRFWGSSSAASRQDAKSTLHFLETYFTPSPSSSPPHLPSSPFFISIYLLTFHQAQPKCFLSIRRSHSVRCNFLPQPSLWVGLWSTFAKSCIQPPPLQLLKLKLLKMEGRQTALEFQNQNIWCND